MNGLATALDALQDGILHHDASVLPRLRAEGADPADRLRVYADAYRLRLVDVLGNDFAATRAVAGEDAFAALVVRYLQAHPSTQPSVRHAGSAFPDWLQAQPGLAPGLHELAWFEWLQAAAFDAADAPALDAGALAALPPERWPALRLRLHPAVRLLDTDRLAIAGGVPAPSSDVQPARWLFWRDGSGDVRWRQLEADEADALHAVAREAGFGELCDRLCVLHGDAGALRAASLLKRWLADGLLIP
jgi:hypothetical protein